MKFILSLAALAASTVFAGPGHGPGQSHAEPGAPTAHSGPVRLTETMAKNLDLRTAEAELGPIERSFAALGRVEAEPSRVTAISSRVAGRVAGLAIREGQRVTRGQRLFSLESRVVAEPPPVLTFEAPMDAVVLACDLVEGGPVEPDRSLAILVDLSEVRVVAEVREEKLHAVRPGQRVQVRAIAHPDLVFSAEVVTTAAEVNRASGTLAVHLKLDNPHGKLLPGMRARLAFVESESDATVLVPREAVLGEGGDLFVFMESDETPLTFERVAVVVGLRDARRIEIIDGVLPGDRVVTRGNHQLQHAGGAGAARIEDDHGHPH